MPDFECGLLGKVYPHWDMISFRHDPLSSFPTKGVNIESVNDF